MRMTGFRLGTIRGIPIRIHVTFLLVLPLLAYAFSRAFREAARVAQVPAEQLSGSPWLWGLGVALALFASVLVHELGHSLYARRAGGRVRDITLLMIGGVSQMSEPPKSPAHEAVMAVIGPLVSLALGAVFYGLHVLTPPSAFNLQFAFFYLASLNVLLGAFNLLPAFPMDGGRVLRALLVKRLGVVRATNVAARVGKLFAVLFGLWGFFTFNMLLLLVAFFVYIGAEAETQSVMVKALLGHLKVSDVMNRQVFTVPASSTVHEAAERMLRERRLAFAATVDGKSVGLVTLDAVQAVPADRRRQVTVGSIAVEVPPLSPDEDAGKALRLMSESSVPRLAVTDHGHLVGMISRDDIVRNLKLVELEATQHPSAGWTQDPHQLPT